MKAKRSLLFIEGLDSPRGLWRHQLAYFSSEWDVSCLQLDSVSVPRAACRADVIDSAVLELKAGLTRVESLPFAFIAHSVAGNVLLQLAADFPELVSGLVLVNTSAFYFTSSPARTEGSTVSGSIDSREAARRVTAPVLLVSGNGGAVLDCERIMELHRLISDSMLIEMVGTGVPPEKADRFNSILEAFLGELRLREQMLRLYYSW